MTATEEVRAKRDAKLDELHKRLTGAVAATSPQVIADAATLSAN